MAALGPRHLCEAMFDEFGEAGPRTRGRQLRLAWIRHEGIARADRPGRQDGKKQRHGPTPYHVGPELPGFAFPPLAHFSHRALGLREPGLLALQDGAQFVIVRDRIRPPARRAGYPTRLCVNPYMIMSDSASADDP
jgi:hypothetical protein